MENKNNRLLHYKTKRQFDEDLSNNLISDKSIVFIKDIKQIYTHGSFYGTDQLDIVIDQYGNKVVQDFLKFVNMVQFDDVAQFNDHVGILDLEDVQIYNIGGVDDGRTLGEIIADSTLFWEDSETNNN